MPFAPQIIFLRFPGLSITFLMRPMLPSAFSQTGLHQYSPIGHPRSLNAIFPSHRWPPTASLSPQLEHFLSAGEAPIAFTPGTGHRHASRYFAVALKALERLGRRGLLITPFAEQIPRDLPPGVMWIPHAPFNLPLRRLVALVHHGGIGTTAEAFRSGIPQLIVPFAFDQFDNGSRARRLGVAEVLLTWQMTPRRLADRLTRLLSSAVVSRSCAKVAELAQRPAQSSLVECLEEALSITEGA
jgi:rhamnosyltransferase subunit B